MPVIASLPPSPALTRRSSRDSHAVNRSPGSATMADCLFLGQMDVVVIERLAVDAVARRGDPGRDLSPLNDRLKERADRGFAPPGRQPLAAAALPLVRAELLPVGGRLDAGERADVPVERGV